MTGNTKLLADSLAGPHQISALTKDLGPHLMILLGEDSEVFRIPDSVGGCLDQLMVQGKERPNHYHQDDNLRQKRCAA